MSGNTGTWPYGADPDFRPTRERLKRSLVVARAWEREEHRGGREDLFSVVKYSVLYYSDGDFIVHLSKPVKCTTPRMSCNVNCGL